LLSGLIFNRDGESGGDQRLRDEIMTMLHAGFETVSDQLVWNFYTLSNHPTIEQTVRDEADNVLSGRIPALADLRHLPQLHMVQQEIMRIYPVAWGYFRTALADDRIDGYRIPANALVIISPYVTHRLKGVWENPEEFKPERFRPEEVARRHRFAFFPFGAGPRHCIGGDVATLLIAMTIATLLQRFRLEVQPGQRIRPVPRISLKPEPAVWVRVRCRS
jgi:cytochrome P450